MGRRHLQHGLQGDHEQAEQLPVAVACLPGPLRPRVDVQDRVVAGRRQVARLLPVTGPIRCPPSLKIADTVKKNYESESFGNISLQKAIEVSCDTVFYGVAYNNWLNEGGVSAGLDAADPFTEMAKAYGMNEKTGIDLTAEARSRMFDRQGKYDYWKAIRERRLQGRADATRRLGDPALDEENCSPQGGIYLPGEAANFAIGQGSTRR